LYFFLILNEESRFNGRKYTWEDPHSHIRPNIFYQNVELGQILKSKKYKKQKDDGV
jgi:hypothetical protein